MKLRLCSLRQQQRTWAESENWRSHNNEVQKQKLRKEKLLRLRQRCACSAVVVDRSPCMMHIWHSQPFHGVTCVLLAGGCNLTGPRNIVAEISPLDLYAHQHASFELRPGKSARSARACLPSIGKEGADCRSKGDILADGGSWHTRESSKSIFSTMTTFHVTVNGWPVSTGIRLLCRNESLWLESAIFAFFRAERPVWKGTRRKNWQEKYCLCWW